MFNTKRISMSWHIKLVPLITLAYYIDYTKRKICHQHPEFLGHPNSSSAKFRVPSSKFRQVPPSSAKFQVPSSKFRVPSSESKFQVPSSKFRVPSSAKFRVPSSEFQVPPSSKFRQVPSSQVPSLVLLYWILFNSTQLLPSFTEYILHNGFMLRKSRNINGFMFDTNF